MVDTNALSPLLQGELDATCGLYSIINAIRLSMRPRNQLPQRTWRRLFADMLEEVAERHNRADLCASGMNANQMVTALRCAVEIMEQRHGVLCSYSRPLLKAGRPDWLAVVDLLRRYDEPPNTSIILGLDGRLQHWTVLGRVTTHYVAFFDSSHYRGVRIDRCRMRYEASTQKPTEHVFALGGVFLVKVAH